MARTVDDILVTEKHALAENVFSDYNVRFEHETLSHGPGRLWFSGMNIVLEKNFSFPHDAVHESLSHGPYSVA